MTSFRAIWPITDLHAGMAQLVAQARPELPRLLAQAHARPTGIGRFTVAASAHVPGSGRVTEWVLLYECPARPAPVRVVPTNYAAASSKGVDAAAEPTSAAGTEGEAARQPATTAHPRTATSTGDNAA
ncbi:hypothetical protein [Nocardioides sp. Arc9.136]|uniref:hypothetical protein n=1 Tax=Nocardioides sp. Arc9.136 TaxID=2996826 RepID=UPI002666A869|nr:hypothetical protein [Nocardioides sp. Arc9.136]WKN47126.1 hypothetical protein OSR43_13870 [Nocardioides sp. Arc9.136]